MRQQKPHASVWQPDLTQLRKEVASCGLGQALSFPLHKSELQGYCQYYGYDKSAALASGGFSLGHLQYDNMQVSAYWWQQAHYRGSIILVPGLFDHVGIYQKFIQFLLREGWDVFAIDMPGHGLSEGPRAEIASFSCYGDVIETALQKLLTLSLKNRFILLGQSTGGAAVAHYLMSHASKTTIKKAVLLAPLLRPVSWFSVNWSWILANKFIKHVPRKFAVNSNDEGFLDFLANRDPLQPQKISLKWVGAMRQWVKCFASLPNCETTVLIIQGDDDGTVDWQFNLERFKEKFSAHKVVIIPGARHHLVNESEEHTVILEREIRKFL